MMDIDDQREAIRDLVRRMMEKTGLDATGLARAADVAPSTLSRFLYQPVKHLLSARTLAKLSEASGVPVPVGSPLVTPLEREVLSGLRSTDEQGREMIRRFVRSLRQPDEEPPAAPSPEPKERAPPPRPTKGGNAARSPDKEDCSANVAKRRLRSVVEVEGR